MEATLTHNNYKHAESVYKGKARSIILAKIMETFTVNTPLHTVTLGGEDMKLENRLKPFYKLSGVSYEFNSISAKNAVKKAPNGVQIVEDNIFNHEYTGKEDVIWFDFMTALRPDNVVDLIEWVVKNPIKKDMVFAVTYTLHSRNVKGEGYRQLFGEDEEYHDAYIEETANTIAMWLSNEYAEPIGGVSITRYANVDIGTKSLPMVQFVYTIRKK